MAASKLEFEEYAKWPYYEYSYPLGCFIRAEYKTFELIFNIAERDDFGKINEDHFILCELDEQVSTPSTGPSAVPSSIPSTGPSMEPSSIPSTTQSPSTVSSCKN